MAGPAAHLFVKSTSTDVHFRAFCAAADAASIAAGGMPYLSARLHDVQVLEPMSRGAHLWAASFPNHGARSTALAALKEALASLHDEDAPVVLAMDGLPPEGLPDDAIPTAANVTPPPLPGPRAYMLIEGTPEDQARIDNYRDVILPMIKERGGYYTVFVLGAGVEVLSGTWNESVFAISRWADMSRAHDFWLSDRYQSVAIPMRLKAGRFSVLLAAGHAG
jgi:uncharacterized protein (DUF1330 family)